MFAIYLLRGNNRRQQNGEICTVFRSANVSLSEEVSNKAIFTYNIFMVILLTFTNIQGEREREKGDPLREEKDLTRIFQFQCGDTHVYPGTTICAI